LMRPWAPAVVTPIVCSAESISIVTAVLGANPVATTVMLSPPQGEVFETETDPCSPPIVVDVVVDDELGGSLPTAALAANLIVEMCGAAHAAPTAAADPTPKRLAKSRRLMCGAGWADARDESSEPESPAFVAR
jgi:hypothetical protein